MYRSVAVRGVIWLWSCSYTVHAVHGFVNATYDVMEGDRLHTYFQLNNITTPGFIIAGNITAKAGGTASQLYLQGCNDYSIDVLQMILILLHLTHCGLSILWMFVSSHMMII